MRALPSVCIELKSHIMHYAPLRAVRGETHAAGCTGSQGITGQNGRQEPRKENRKPTTGNCLLREKSGNSLTIRHHCFTLPHLR